MLPLSILPFFQPHFTIFLHLITVVLTSLGRLRLSDEGALEQVASKYSREGCLMSYGQYIEYPTGLMPQLHEFPAHVGQILHLMWVMWVKFDPHEMWLMWVKFSTSALSCPLF